MHFTKLNRFFKPIDDQKYRRFRAIKKEQKNLFEKPYWNAIEKHWRHEKPKVVKAKKRKVVEEYTGPKKIYVKRNFIPHQHTPIITSKHTLIEITPQQSKRLRKSSSVIEQE